MPCIRDKPGQWIAIQQQGTIGFFKTGFDIIENTGQIKYKTQYDVDHISHVVDKHTQMQQNTAAAKAETENEKSTADSAVAEKKTAKKPTKSRNNVNKNAANNANVNAQGESAQKRRGRPKGSKNKPKN